MYKPYWPKANGEMIKKVQRLEPNIAIDYIIGEGPFRARVGGHIHTYQTLTKIVLVCARP